MREIREWSKLREALQPQFGEMFLLAGLFAFSLGLMLTLIFALPQEKDVEYYIWLFWTCGFIMMLIVAVEFLIRKFRIMRRVIELHLKQLEGLDARETELRKLAEALRQRMDSAEDKSEAED